MKARMKSMDGGNTSSTHCPDFTPCTFKIVLAIARVRASTACATRQQPRYAPFEV